MNYVVITRIKINDYPIVDCLFLCYIQLRNDGKIMKYLNKMIAPVIITILFIIYFVGIALSMSVINELPFLYKVLFVVIPFLMAIVMIVVLIGRIKEIRSGEEDDLSQY